MHKKKLKGALFALATATILTVSSTGVYAAEPTSFDDSTASSTDGTNFVPGTDTSQNQTGSMTDHTFGGTSSKPSETKGQSIKVYATKASSVQIKVPQVLVGGSSKSEYLVGVKGDITSKQSVTVAPLSNTFKLTNVYDSSKSETATISQTKTDWSYSDLSASDWVYSKGTISYNTLKAGSYNGTFNLAVNLNYSE